MAVSLPPPLTPQLGSVEELRTRAPGATVLAFQDFRLHVFGSDALTETQLQAAIANADNLSNAVRAIASAYYSAGYPAAQIVYALNGTDLYVMVLLGTVTTAAGPEYLTSYFEGMDATEPFTDAKMERRRTLASLHADRAGKNATPLLVLQRNGTYQFDMRPDDNGPKPWSVRAEISNPGNRFVGRHFGDLDGKYNTRWGDEFRLLGRRSLDFLNDSSDNVDYAEYSFAWNRVTPWGVFGVMASNSLYHIEVPDVFVNSQVVPALPVRGELTYGELDWFTLLAAGFTSRWTLQTRLGRSNKTLDGESSNVGRLQHQLYNWVELSTLFSTVYNLGTYRFGVDGGISVGKGLSQSEDDITMATPVANLDYLVWKPSLRFQLATATSWTLTLDATGQITDDNLPEQQQWVIGGITNGAAYLPGIAVGDDGGAARLTVESPAIPFLQHFKVAPKLFVEYAAAEYENQDRYSAQTQGRPAIADVGLGLALSAWQWLEVGLSYAEGFYDQDIAQETLDASRGRLFFSLAGKF